MVRRALKVSSMNEQTSCGLDDVQNADAARKKIATGHHTVASVSLAISSLVKSDITFERTMQIGLLPP